ncbi:WhiB family transcriptional regulator [Streptomyces sp. 8N706]|uniref:WhiB family transcriptional regulator n=1 Tax=Streptomyces sp. 8N706 TaxID=3457416 RepID=UPI003FD5CF27
MSRTGIPNTPGPTEADPRIPFPFTDTPTACQTHPRWFSHEQTSTRAAEQDIAKAKLACSGCPIVTDCLKWALAHPDLTRVGVWAATTTRQRGQLRRRLANRLGPDWVGVIAQRDQDARQRPRPPLPQATTAPTEREKTLARLEPELIPTRPTPYEPWREPLTPHRQAHNRHLLELDLAQRSA